MNEADLQYFADPLSRKEEMELIRDLSAAQQKTMLTLLTEYEVSTTEC